MRSAASGGRLPSTGARLAQAQAYLQEFSAGLSLEINEEKLGVLWERGDECGNEEARLE